jgi:hypothetical protein
LVYNIRKANNACWSLTFRLILKKGILVVLVSAILVLGFVATSQFYSNSVVDAKKGGNKNKNNNNNEESVSPSLGADNSNLTNSSLASLISENNTISSPNLTQSNLGEQPTENATPPPEANATVTGEEPTTGEGPTSTTENATPPPEANATVTGEAPPTENATPPPEANATVTGEAPPTENATSPEANATVTGGEQTTTGGGPTSTTQNVTSPPETNATTQQQNTNTNNNTSSAANVTTKNAPPVGGVDILSTNANASADEALPPEQPSTNNATTTNATSSETAETTSDTLDQTTPPEDTLGAQVSNQTDKAAAAAAGVSASNSKVENNQVSNIQNVINNIAISAAQSGGNSQNIAQQISNDIIANPKGPIANSIKQLANEFSQGNADEVNIAADQIGSLVAKGNNIQQTLVQVTNNVVNNIKNIKATENNYDKVIISPSYTTQQKSDITQTLNTIKKGKQEVDVPRIHIKFHSHERNLVLRVLTTNNYRYDMPFSKFNGAFTLNDNEFRVKILSGDGSIKAASVAPMFKSGKIGDRDFLDKDVNNGKVFFSLKGVDSGKYLLEVYVKLSNGAIGTFARGSVSIK